MSNPGKHHRVVHRLAASRPDQEDRILILDRGDQLVVGVADGAGGIPGGGEAADMVIGMVASAGGDLARTSWAGCSVMPTKPSRPPRRLARRPPSWW